MAYAFPVTPVEGAAVEMLTFDFPRVTRTGAVLRLQWGTKSLNLAIEVGAPAMTRTISAGQAAPYLGRYDLSFVGDRAEPAERMTAEIVLRDGHLLMAMSGFESELVPTKVPDEFLMGFLDQGVIVDIDPEFPLRFRMAGGRAVGITAKANDGSEWIKGNRLP